MPQKVVWFIVMDYVPFLNVDNLQDFLFALVGNKSCHWTA